MFEREHTASPERALWSNVLLIAIADALQGPEAVPDRTTRLRTIEEARGYLTRPSKDLSLVCAGAGIDMDALIERMHQRIAEAPTPEELVSTRKTNRAHLSKRAKRERKQAHGPITYTLDGETLTVAEWSERTGVKIATIKARIAKGWDVKDAITLTRSEAKRRSHESFGALMHTLYPGKKGGSPERLLTHNGQTHTIKQWAKITGLKIGNIKNRLGKGWSVADALDPADRRTKPAIEERQAA